MPRRPKKVYNAALGKMVPFEESDFAKSSYEPVYGSDKAHIHPDRMNITQKVMDVPPETKKFRKPVKVQGAGPQEDIEKYHNFLHSVYDAVIITDTEGLISEINARAIHSFIWDREEMLLANIIELISGADEQVLNVIHQNMDEKKFTVLEAICIRKDGTFFNAEIVANKLRGEGPLRIVFFIRDITERKQIEKDLEKASEMLVEAEKMQARMDTLSTVIHAINNPLQILTCKAELDDDKEYKKQLDRILNVITRLKQDESLETIVDEESGSIRYDIQEQVELTDCNLDHMLVVDDELPLRDMFVAALSSKFPEKQINSAGDGQEAVNMFKETFPGVIIMDVSMPVMNGVDAYKNMIAACENAARRRPSFVFCTGFSMSEELMQVIGDGSTNICLEKPLSLSDLTEAVESRLQQ